MPKCAARKPVARGPGELGDVGAQHLDPAGAGGMIPPSSRAASTCRSREGRSAARARRAPPRNARSRARAARAPGQAKRTRATATAGAVRCGGGDGRDVRRGNGQAHGKASSGTRTAPCCTSKAVCPRSVTSVTPILSAFGSGRRRRERAREKAEERSAPARTRPRTRRGLPVRPRPVRPGWAPGSISSTLLSVTRQLAAPGGTRQVRADRRARPRRPRLRPAPRPSWRGARSQPCRRPAL